MNRLAGGPYSLYLPNIMHCTYNTPTYVLIVLYKDFLDKKNAIGEEEFCDSSTYDRVYDSWPRFVSAREYVLVHMYITNWARTNPVA